MFWDIYENKSIKEALDFLEFNKYYIDNDETLTDKLNNLNITE